MDKKLIYILGAIVISVLVILGIWLASRGDYEEIPNAQLLTFSDCEAAGYPVTGTDPRICTAPDGSVFSESGAVQSLVRDVATPAGTLVLSFNEASSTATLSGELARSTPCVDYRVSIAGSTSTNEIVFRIADAAPDAVCIQVLGEPQQISAVTAATSDTRYIVYFENEVVFSGKLARVVPTPYTSLGQLAFATDEPVRFIPQAAVSVKYLIEHRSAFDGQPVSVQGRVVATQIGSYICVTEDQCGRGQVVLGLIEKRKRVEGYNVIIITAGGVSPRDFPTGEYVEVSGTAHVVGDTVYVFRKAPARSKVVTRYFTSPLTILK